MPTGRQLRPSAANGRRHGIVDRRRDGTDVPVNVSTYELARLEKLAVARNIEPREWLRQAASAAIRDDLSMR